MTVHTGSRVISKIGMRPEHVHNNAPPPTITPPMMTAATFHLKEGKSRFIIGNFIIRNRIFHKSKGLETKKV